MVICSKCRRNKWKVFKTTKESSGMVCLECVKCGNRELAFLKDGRILVSSRDANHHKHSFVPLECVCKKNEWEILQGKIICVCKRKFYLNTKIEVSRETRPPKKVEDYWGIKKKTRMR